MERTRSAADPTTRQMSCCRFVADLLSIPLLVLARREGRVERKPPPSRTDRYAGARFPHRGIDHAGGCRFGCRFRAFPAGACPGPGRRRARKCPKSRSAARRGAPASSVGALHSVGFALVASFAARSPRKPAPHRSPGARRATAADLHWSAARDGRARTHSSRRSIHSLRRDHHEMEARRGPAAALPCLPAPELLPAGIERRSRRTRHDRCLLVCPLRIRAGMAGDQAAVPARTPGLASAGARFTPRD